LLSTEFGVGVIRIGEVLFCFADESSATASELDRNMRIPSITSLYRSIRLLTLEQR
jgi:hypothetical protein